MGRKRKTVYRIRARGDDVVRSFAVAVVFAAVRS
jgi:hypothetical protein